MHAVMVMHHQMVIRMAAGVIVRVVVMDEVVGEMKIAPEDPGKAARMIGSPRQKSPRRKSNQRDPLHNQW